MPFDGSLIEAIIHESRSHSVELPWIEFKSNFQDPQTIGEYVSALSNTAALFNQAHGFLIWGINDSTHDITGTNIYYHTSNQLSSQVNKVDSRLLFCFNILAFYLHIYDI